MSSGGSVSVSDETRPQPTSQPEPEYGTGEFLENFDGLSADELYLLAKFVLIEKAADAKLRAKRYDCGHAARQRVFETGSSTAINGGNERQSPRSVHPARCGLAIPERQQAETVGESGRAKHHESRSGDRT